MILENKEWLLQILVILGIILLEYIMYVFLKTAVLKRIKNKTQKSLASKVLLILFLVVIVVSGGLVLGINVENIWFGIGSVLGLVAIGFVAVWSILGNIFAALILFASRPFKIGSTIYLCEREIEGEVIEITLFFTVLKKEDKLYHVPNTVFFQKEFAHVVQEKK